MRWFPGSKTSKSSPNNQLNNIFSRVAVKLVFFCVAAARTTFLCKECRCFVINTTLRIWVEIHTVTVLHTVKSLPVSEHCPLPRRIMARVSCDVITYTYTLVRDTIVEGFVSYALFIYLAYMCLVGHLSILCHVCPCDVSYVIILDVYVES